jgi:Hsp70 protein
MSQGIGLSVGASNMAVVALRRTAALRQSVLTLYRHRAPEIGVPSENPNLNEPGLIVTGFADRVGDPVGMVAADGSVHRGEVLVADALEALLRTVADGRAQAEPVTVTHPAHWRPAAVEALRAALGGASPLISDAAAALTALQADPGLPTRGVIALCDFGGTGTSITLADAANGFQPIGPTVRHAEFSGELIDQALLGHVLADLSGAGSVSSPDSVTGTSALASLSRLRAQCRGAKERLSATTVTSLFADLPGYRAEVRLTRNELDDEIRQPLAEFIAVLWEVLDRNGIHPSDLAAVASVGGGACIPAVTTTLSEHLRVPVITTARPELAAAEGAALRAAWGSAEESATRMAAPAAVLPTAVPADDQSATMSALAWSEDDSAPEVEAYQELSDPPGGLTGARPHLEFEPEPQVTDEAAAVGYSWYRPVAVSAAIVAVAVLTVAGAYVVHRNDSKPMSGATTSSVSPPPATATAAPPALANQGQPEQAPPAPAMIQAPAPRARTAPAPANQPANQLAPAPPPPADVPPPPATTTPPPPPPTTTDPPPTTQPPATTTTQPSTTTTQPPTSAQTPPTSTQPSTSQAAPPPSSSQPASPTKRPRETLTIPPLPGIPGVTSPAPNP